MLCPAFVGCFEHGLIVAVMASDGCHGFMPDRSAKATRTIQGAAIAEAVGDRQGQPARRDCPGASRPHLDRPEPGYCVAESGDTAITDGRATRSGEVSASAKLFARDLRHGLVVVPTTARGAGVVSVNRCLRSVTSVKLMGNRRFGFIGHGVGMRHVKQVLSEVMRLNHLSRHLWRRSCRANLHRLAALAQAALCVAGADECPK